MPRGFHLAVVEAIEETSRWDGTRPASAAGALRHGRPCLRSGLPEDGRHGRPAGGAGAAPERMRSRPEIKLDLMEVSGVALVRRTTVGDVT